MKKWVHCLWVNVTNKSVKTSTVALIPRPTNTSFRFRFKIFITKTDTMVILQSLKGSSNLLLTQKHFRSKTHLGCNFILFNGWLKKQWEPLSFIVIIFLLFHLQQSIYMSNHFEDHRLCNSQPPQLPSRADIGAFSLILLKDTVSWPQVRLQNKKIESMRFACIKCTLLAH